MTQLTSQVLEDFLEYVRENLSRTYSTSLQYEAWAKMVSLSEAPCNASWSLCSTLRPKFPCSKSLFAKFDSSSVRIIFRTGNVKKERKATNSGGGRGEDTVFSFLNLYRFWHSPKWRRPMCVRWFFLKILDIFFKWFFSSICVIQSYLW